MASKARKLERDPNEWGENMDIQAAAIYYNVEIDVAIETGGDQV